MNQSPIDDDDDFVLHESRKILRDFYLCDSCLGRFFVKRRHLASSKLLGKKIKSQINDYSKNMQQRCYICKNLLDHLDSYVDKLLEISKDTSYSSFLIGTSLKPSFMDRDDFIRSKFKAKGIDSIKTEITKQLVKSFSKKSKKTFVLRDSDITFLVNFRTDICEQRTKPLIISGRYTKHVRGLPQKQRSCSDCGGKGCIFCNNRGISEFDTSVEGIIAKFLYEFYDCIQVKFTWIGGEDKDSLVGGSGRLFFAKIINPKRRDAKLGKRIHKLGNRISLFKLCPIEQIPTDPVKFRSCVSLQIQVNDDTIKASSLSKLKQLTKNPIQISDDSKTILRTIHDISYKKTSPDTFTMDIVSDGGVSMKRLVDGDGVQPNVSALLGTSCTCITFDFKDIMIVSKL